MLHDYTMLGRPDPCAIRSKGRLCQTDQLKVCIYHIFECLTLEDVTCLFIYNYSAPCGKRKGIYHCSFESKLVTIIDSGGCKTVALLI